MKANILKAKKGQQVSPRCILIQLSVALLNALYIVFLLIPNRVHDYSRIVIWGFTSEGSTILVASLFFIHRCSIDWRAIHQQGALQPEEEWPATATDHGLDVEWNSHDKAVASLKCPAHDWSSGRRHTLATVHVGVGPRLSGNADNRAGGALTRREKIGDGICKKKTSKKFA